jgi:hypothetical protein
MGASEDNPFPPGDLVTRNQCEILLGDGDNIRYVKEGPRWSSNYRGFVEARYISTFNGEVSMSGAFSRQGYDRNACWLAARFQDQHARVWPITWVYRPLSSFIDLNEWTLLPRTQEVDGRTCVVLEMEITSRGSYRQLFLDVHRDFVPIQVRQLFKGRPRLHMVIDYKDDPTWGPIPVSWKSSGLELDGSLNSAFSATIDSWSINQPIAEADATFVIDFPPNTVAYDYRDKSVLVVHRDGSRSTYSNDDIEHGIFPDDRQSSWSIGGGWVWRLFMGAFTAIVVGSLVAAVLIRRYGGMRSLTR